LTLTVYSDGQPYKTYPVAVGRPKASTLTPVGEWRVIHKGLNWGGGFGTRWIGRNVPWGIYGIHGTNNPASIGTRASAGCIRMFTRAGAELSECATVGTPVAITGVKRPQSFGRTLDPRAQGRDVVGLQLGLHATGADAGAGGAGAGGGGPAAGAGRARAGRGRRGRGRRPARRSSGAEAAAAVRPARRRAGVGRRVLRAGAQRARGARGEMMRSAMAVHGRGVACAAEAAAGCGRNRRGPMVRGPGLRARRKGAVRRG